MTAFADDFEAADGTLNGRVSPTGHAWNVLNDNAVISSGRYIRDPTQPSGSPSSLAVTPSGSGGTFAAGTYYWKVSAIRADGGETGASGEVSAAVAAGGSAALSWALPAGAAGVKVYRATASGGEGTSPALIATLGAVTSYTDTGTAASAGAAKVVSGGCYSQINLDAPVTSMSAVGSWNGTSSQASESSSLVLIYGHADIHGGTPPNEQIFRESVHCVFTPYNVSIDLYTDGLPVDGTLISFTYPSPIAFDGTTYQFGLERRGRILTLNCPDGVARKIAHPLYEEYAGPYLIYQCYDTQWPAMQPRFESVAATTDPLSGFVPSLRVPDVLGLELDRS